MTSFFDAVLMSNDNYARNVSALYKTSVSPQVTLRTIGDNLDMIHEKNFDKLVTFICKKSNQANFV